MGQNSNIEWTDHTFNPWWGCTKVAAGCAHCYAEAFSKRTGKEIWGEHGQRRMTSEANWKLPLKWNREAEKAGKRARVFCASMADVFEDWGGLVLQHAGFTLWKCSQCGVIRDGGAPELQTVPVDCYKHGPCKRLIMSDVRERLFALIDATPHLDWLLLTKRPENILDMWPCARDTNGDGNCHICSKSGFCPRPNVWLGTSVANQEDANRNIPLLLKCRNLSPVLFLSMEPLLGPVNLCSVNPTPGCDLNALSGAYISRVNGTAAEWGHGPSLDWIIAGGESGRGARPIDPEWVELICDRCDIYKVPFFFKQWGGVNKKAAGREFAGREWSDFPVTMMPVQPK